MASSVTSRASFGSGELVVLVHHARQQRAIERSPVDADAHRLAVFDGRLDHGAEVIVVLLADVDVAGIDAVFRQRAGACGILLEQQMAVVMEVADDRHAHAEHVERVDDLRHGGGRGVGIHGDAYEFGTGAGERHDLIDGGSDVGGIRVGHGLDHDRIRPAHFHTADIHRNRLAARDLCHPASVENKEKSILSARWAESGTMRA